MASTKRLSFICYAITFLEFLAILLQGTLGSISGNEIGYCISNFYLLMPVTSFVIALILGLKNADSKGLYPVLFGLFGFVIPIIVFKGSWSLIALFFSFIPALLGLAIGWLIYHLRS